MEIYNFEKFKANKNKEKYDAAKGHPVILRTHDEYDGQEGKMIGNQQGFIVILTQDNKKLYLSGTEIEFI